MSDNDFPVSGILDVVHNRAVVRVDGYLPSPDDIAVAPALMRDNDLRRGDTVAGSARNNRLVAVGTVNDRLPGYSRARFDELIPLYPNERLRLETEPHELTTRVI